MAFGFNPQMLAQIAPQMLGRQPLNPPQQTVGRFNPVQGGAAVQPGLAGLTDANSLQQQIQQPTSFNPALSQMRPPMPTVGGGFAGQGGLIASALGGLGSPQFGQQFGQQGQGMSLHQQLAQAQQQRDPFRRFQQPLNAMGNPEGTRGGTFNQPQQEIPSFIQDRINQFQTGQQGLNPQLQQGLNQLQPQQPLPQFQGTPSNPQQEAILQQFNQASSPFQPGTELRPEFVPMAGFQGMTAEQGQEISQNALQRQNAFDEQAHLQGQQDIRTGNFRPQQPQSGGFLQGGDGPRIPASGGVGGMGQGLASMGQAILQRRQQMQQQPRPFSPTPGGFQTNSTSPIPTRPQAGLAAAVQPQRPMPQPQQPTQRPQRVAAPQTSQAGRLGGRPINPQQQQQPQRQGFHGFGG